MLDFSRSFVEKKTLFGREFHIKRDDCLHPICNGNKARKFAALLEAGVDSETLGLSKCWVSYGGIQSNAMAALAYLAFLRGVRLLYVAPCLEAGLDSKNSESSTFQSQCQDSKHLASQTPASHNHSNLSYALKWGMELITLPQGSPVSALKSHALSLVQNLGATFIPQGGRIEWARLGMRALALELRGQISPQAVIFYTSGSGVGVVALQEALCELMPRSRLICLACAGERGELEARFSAYSLPQPSILYTPFKFAKPYLEVWAMREYLANRGVRVDLIYDSVGFCAIRAVLKGELGGEELGGLRRQILKNELVFIHSGGLSGDVSQEARYRQKFGERLTDSEMEARILALD